MSDTVYDCVLKIHLVCKADGKAVQLSRTLPLNFVPFVGLKLHLSLDGSRDEADEYFEVQQVEYQWGLRQFNLSQFTTTRRPFNAEEQYPNWKVDWNE
jgi:hypothetical protein